MNRDELNYQLRYNNLSLRIARNPTLLEVFRNSAVARSTLQEAAKAGADYYHLLEVCLVRLFEANTKLIDTVIRNEDAKGYRP